MLLSILFLLFISSGLILYTFMDSGTNVWFKHSSDFSIAADENLQRMFIFSDTSKLVKIYSSLMILIPILLFLLDVSWVGIAIVFSLLYISPKLYFKRLSKKRSESINAALPDALTQISGAMRAGSTFIMALQSMVEEQKGPISQEFSLVLREQRLGTRLEEALDNLGERVQTEEMDLVISAALISQDIGGNLAEIFSRLAETIRRKIEMEGKVKALTAQGVLQGYVVTSLPFFILLALMTIEPEATRPIFTSLLGWMFLAVIITLQLVGGFMIRKIVAIDV